MHSEIKKEQKNQHIHDVYRNAINHNSHMHNHLLNVSQNKNHLQLACTIIT